MIKASGDMSEMVKNRKRLLALMCVGAIILCGCEKKVTLTGNAEEQETEEGLNTEERTIVIWEYERDVEGFGKALEELARRASDTEINGRRYCVIAKAVPEETYDTELMTAYVNQEAPDIVFGSPASPALYTGIGAVIDLPLETWMQEPDWADGVSQKAYDFFVYRGMQCGLPVTQKGLGIIYNKEIFKHAGIESLPDTYEEWYEVCERLLDIGVIPWISGVEEIGVPDPDSLFYWAASNQCELWDGRERAALDDPKCLEVWEFFRKNIEEGYLPEYALQIEEQAAQEYFLSGESAMYLGTYPEFVGENAEKYGVLPMIAGPSCQGEPNHPVVYQGYYCLRSNHDPDTLAVLKWWYENSSYLWEDYPCDRIPCSADVLESISYEQPLYQEWIAENLDDSSTVTYFYPRVTYPDYASELLEKGYLLDVLEALYAGGTIEEGVQKANMEMDQLMEKYINR